MWLIYDRTSYKYLKSIEKHEFPIGSWTYKPKNARKFKTVDAAVDCLEKEMKYNTARFGVRLLSRAE